VLKKLRITVDSNAFEFEGADVPFAEVFKLAGDWFHAVLNVDQAKVDALTDRLKTSDDRLATAVSAATPKEE
jgi:hypothetical protein